MDFSTELAISYYKTIAVINQEHNIYLVQHQENKKFFVKKILDVYNRNIYEYLYKNPITGTPKILEYFEVDNQLVVIEEYISGYSLLEKIQNHSLCEQDVINYTYDLCSILERLHGVNPAIIHRDIKPSNVIITSYNRAVLLDFNAAKYLSTSSEDTVLLGTQGYAAPEQYGFGSSSQQTDIYALGIMLKEMLESIETMSASYKEIISKCTQIDPSKRYQNIAELRADLQLHKGHSDSKSIPQNVLQYFPPGFRTLTPWKIILATPCYLFIFWLCLTLEVQDTYGLALWIERITLLAMMIFVICGSFNYLNIQKFVPLCKHKYRILRYLGILLLDLTVVIALMIILLLVEAIFFPIQL